MAHSVDLKPRAPATMRRRGPGSQRGQSLVEMAIACIVLVPLAAGVMLLGQYIHIKQQTQAAARQAAWAATVDPALLKAGLPAKAGQQTAIRTRQFADARDHITSSAKTPAQFGDHMLTTFAGQKLMKTSDLTLTVYKQETAPTFLDKALGGVAKVAKSLGNLPPNPQGLVIAEVHSRPQKLRGSDGHALAFLDPLDSAQLDFSARTVLLADTWSASGGGEKANGEEAFGMNDNRSVRQVIRPMVPTSWLGDKASDVFSDVINVLGKIPIVNDLFTPGFDQFRLGKMAPDVVPADKLVKYKHGH